MQQAGVLTGLHAVNLTVTLSKLTCQIDGGRP